eukprot:519035_1
MALNINSKRDINLSVDGDMITTYDDHSTNNITISNDNHSIYDNHSINHTNNSHDNTYIQNHNVYNVHVNHFHIGNTMDHIGNIVPFTHTTNTSYPTSISPSKSPTNHRTIPIIPTHSPSNIHNTNSDRKRKRKRKQISITDDSFVDPRCIKRVKLNSGRSNHKKPSKMLTEIEYNNLDTIYLGVEI